MKKLKKFDEKILMHINRKKRNPIIDIFMLFITNFGGVVFSVLFPVFYLLYMYRYDNAMIIEPFNIGAALIINTIIVQMMKFIIGRKRPYEDSDSFTKIGFNQITRSFPSGHTSSAAVIYFSLALIYNEFFIVFFILILLIAFSRMYIGVHYPSDVIAGFIIGTTVVIFVQYFDLGIYLLKIFNFLEYKILL